MEADLSWRCWDGEYVVFNPASGNTHILDIASGEILMCLLDGRTGTETVSARLAALLEVDNDAEAEAAATRILDSLAELGLIEPAGQC